MIKAICFDHDGVYFLNGKSNFIKNLGVKYGIAEESAKNVFLKSDEMNKQYKLGKMTDNEFWTWAISEWHINAAVNDIIKLLIDGYEVNNAAAVYVKELRKAGYKTVICSNNFPARINGLQKRFGFLDDFDVKVFSYEVGIDKPDKKIFQALIDRTGLFSNEIFYSDDDESKMLGAAELGIKTYLYTDFDAFITKLKMLGVTTNDFKKDLVIAYNQDAQRRKDNESQRDNWKAVVRKGFLDLLKKEGKNTLLELGAGVGTDSRYFLDNGFDVFAIDISEGMINECKKQGIKAKILDLYDIDKLGCNFDAVYSMNVMLHVPRKDLKEILEKINNVLKPNGLFYYGTYGGITEEVIINDKRTNYLPRFFSKLNDNDLLEATSIFQKVNFEIVELNTEQKGFHFQSLTLRKKEQI